jgi:hypothetical protein
MSKYAKRSAGLLAAWLLFSLFSSALHFYVNAPNRPPIAFGLPGIPAIRPIAEPTHAHSGAKHAHRRFCVSSPRHV